MFLVGQGWSSPKVISAQASTCWPGPLARLLQVRGQRVMKGTVSQSRKGRRGRRERERERRVGVRK